VTVLDQWTQDGHGLGAVGLGDDGGARCSHLLLPDLWPAEELPALSLAEKLAGRNLRGFSVVG